MISARRCSQSLLVLLLVATALGAGEPAFYLKDGDRVVFYGDSITNQRLYGQFVETYVLTRFPQLKVDFVQSGWGGDRVTGGSGGKIDIRLERDVFAYKPTVMTIMLGMNDAGYRPFQQDLFERFTQGYQHIIDTVKRRLPGIRITALQPSPFDDVTRPPEFDAGYNGVLIRYGEFIRKMAAERELSVADLNAPVVAALRKAFATNPELAQKIIFDRVHPAAAGHVLMAAALLKSWNASPLVTVVEIDGSAKVVASARNTEVSALNAGQSISWTQLDAALPMPIPAQDEALMLAVRSSDLIETLNQQTLKVTGLTAGRMRLKIDGEDMGSFTKQQLAAGINLATAPTPMARQAMAVHTLTIKHNSVHETRWRAIQTPLAEDRLANLEQAIVGLDKLESELVERQREAAKPKPHSYELVPE